MMILQHPLSLPVHLQEEVVQIDKGQLLEQGSLRKAWTFSSTQFVMALIVS